MILSNKGAMELIGREAFVQSRYRDGGGNWTIGAGHTKWAGEPDPYTVMVPMSIHDMIALFRKDVQRYATQVSLAVHNMTMTQDQFDALVSFHYNTGAIAHARMTYDILKGDFSQAARDFDLYHSPPSVAGRRSEEKHQFIDGTIAHGGMATIYPATPNGSVLWSDGRRVDLRPYFDGSVVPFAS